MTSKDESDPVNQMLDKVRPYAAKLTFGSIVGYWWEHFSSFLDDILFAFHWLMCLNSSGAAAKKIGRFVAVVVGMGFICIQTGESLHYFELISSLS